MGSVLIIFTNNTPQKIQAIATPAPIPSEGQWTVRFVLLGDVSGDGLDKFISSFFLSGDFPVFLLLLEKKLGTLSSEGNFESDSMTEIKNHADLGFYYKSKKSKLAVIYNI